MSLNLNDDRYSSPSPTASISPAEKEQKGKTVRSLGIASLIMAVIGVFLPCVGTLMLIAAYFMSRHALKLSRDYLLPDEDEKFARWGSSISTVLLVFSVIGLILIVLKAL